MKKFLHEVETAGSACLSAYEFLVSEVDRKYVLKMSYEFGAGFIKDFLGDLEILNLTESNDTDSENESDDDSSDADA